jgi:hypothetical protein
MDHPAQGSQDAAPSPPSFRRCKPDQRCGVCRLLDAQHRRERSLFRTIVAQDEAFLDHLERLVALFYDASVRSSS